MLKCRHENLPEKSHDLLRSGPAPGFAAQSRGDGPVGFDLVNRPVKLTLAEDVEDLAAFEARSHEPNLPFEEVLKDLRQRGKI